MNRRLYVAVAAVLAVAGPARAVIVAGLGAANPSVGTDLGAYLGATTFYAAGYTGTRTNVANIEGSYGFAGHEATTTLLRQPLAGGATASTWSHPTSTAAVLAGRGPTALQRGIAYGATAWGGAIALTTTNSGNSFTITDASVGQTYYNAANGFTAPASWGNLAGRTISADVISSSWGEITTNYSGNSINSIIVDGIIAKSGKCVVIGAGNSGPGANSVAGPATALNCISVAALANTNPTPETTPNYAVVSSFSSRGPSQYFVPRPPAIANVLRPSVSIAAPGENYTLAGYNPPDGAASSPTFYTGNVSGTSFATPTVAGGAALLADLAKDRYAATSGALAYDGRTIKALLLNTADKIPGWTNNSTNVAGVLTTTQGLDYVTGAGRMNLDRAFVNFTAGVNDVPGLSISSSAGGTTVPELGWDFDEVSATQTTDTYKIAQPLLGGTTFTATLAWFVKGFYNPSETAPTLRTTSLDTLHLELLRLDGNAPGVIARSQALYNPVQQLYLTLPETGLYQMRVSYQGKIFSTTGVDGSVTPFALAWSATAVPEPTAVAPILAGGMLTLARRRRPTR